MRVMSAVQVNRLRDHVVGHGVSALSLDDVVELTGLSRGAATEAMRRARAAGQFFAPSPGLYIPIPSEFSTWGVVPAMDFIDQLMEHLGRSYYVALLSAAEVHGAAHQRPQVFQVFADKAVRDRDIERVRLRFYERSDVEAAAVQLVNSRTSRVRVSTPEATAFDLVLRPQESGALFNVATIIGELVQDEKLDVAKLVSLAPQYPLAVVRRLGWLLDRDAEYVETTAFSDALSDFVSSNSVAGRRAVDLLAAGRPRRGTTNRRWGLVENADVEPDL